MSVSDTVLTSREAVARFGRGHVRWMVERGRWQRPARGVIVKHSGTLTPHEQIRCELLAYGRRAVLAGLSAASFDGLQGFPAPATSLLLPRGSRGPDLPGVIARTTRHLEAVDVHPAREPRRTRLPRSIVDAASWASTDLRAQAVLAASVQQRLVTPEQLMTVVHRLPRVARRALLTETIADISGGSLSDYELIFLNLCRRSGLPQPSRQRKRRDAAGRWRYLDAEFDEFDLVVELDGQQHMEPLAWWEDMDRNNSVVIEDGKWLLRFPGFVLRRQGDHLVRQLRAFMENHSRAS